MTPAKKSFFISVLLGLTSSATIAAQIYAYSKQYVVGRERKHKHARYFFFLLMISYTRRDSIKSN